MELLHDLVIIFLAQGAELSPGWPELVPRGGRDTEPSAAPSPTQADVPSVPGSPLQSVSV